MHAQGVLAREPLEQSSELGTTGVSEAAAAKLGSWIEVHSALDKGVGLHFDVPATYPAEAPSLRTARSMTAGERQVFGDLDVLLVLHEIAVDEKPVARNTGMLALLNDWLREAEQGIDPGETRAWEETRAALDADRTSNRKLFP